MRPLTHMWIPCHSGLVRRRVRATASVVSVVAAATLLAACNFIQASTRGAGSSGNPSGVKTMPPYGLTTPTAVLAERACTAADLDVRDVRDGAYQGNVTTSILFVNTGNAGCEIAAPPPISVGLDAGASKAVSFSAATFREVAVAAGGAVRLVLGSPAWCSGLGAPRVAKSVVVTLPGGDRTAYTRLDTQCGPHQVLLFEAVPVPSPATPTSAPAPPKPLISPRVPKISRYERR